MARSMRCSREVRERGVALVFERVGQHASRWAAICSVAAEVNVSGETLGKWVRQAEVDAGARVGASSEDTEELRRLRRENVELRRANEILKAASVFFVRELDPRLPRAADLVKRQRPLAVT